MSDMKLTRRDLKFEAWLALVSQTMDMLYGDEAIEYPHLPWQEWYERGLTVEQAVESGHRALYGGPE